MENISLTRKLVIHRQPEPPRCLDDWERVLMMPCIEPTVVVSRAFIRALLRYVRRLERDVAETGEFWWFAFCNGCPSVFQTLHQPGTNSSRGNWQSRQRNLRRRGLRGGCSPAPSTRTPPIRPTR
jgi:hypothetical protein